MSTNRSKCSKSSLFTSEVSSNKMSRLRSDTYIKPGSESSFDSEELTSRRYQNQLDKYCCLASVSAKNATIFSGILTGLQAIGNFGFLLHGCFITYLDMGMALMPVVFGSAAVLFITFAFLHHSSCSLKPYIIHHVTLALLYFLCLILFAMVIWKQQFSIDILEFLSHFSANFMHLQNAVPNSNLRLMVGGYLFSQLLTSFFCLHLAGSLYSWLDTEKRYLSSEGTEII